MNHRDTSNILKNHKEKIMILKNKYAVSSDMYVSKLTDELDRLAGFTTNSIRKHYILIDDYCRKKSIYAIRVPGGTVGEIRVDETNKVVGIVIDTGYVVKTCPNAACIFAAGMV